MGQKLEKVEKLIERIVCQCWSFDSCFSLYVNKPLFYYLFFNVFVLVVELIWFIPFQIIMSSYFFFFLLIVLFNTRKFNHIKVKPRCNLCYRVKEKKKVSWNYKFCKKFGLATRVDGAGAMCSVQIIFTYWLRILDDWCL